MKTGSKKVISLEIERQRDDRFWQELAKKFGRIEWTEEEREHYRQTGEEPTAKILRMREKGYYHKD